MQNHRAGETTNNGYQRIRGQVFDLVVTVCDDAAENCPVWLGQGRKMHIGFADPAKATGSEEERMQAFRALREGIDQRIVAVLRDLR